jgi:mono/diheme cytochrome c family protein
MSSLQATKKRVMLTASILFVAFVSAVTLTVSQENQTTIKKVPAPVVSAADGEKMYEAYCEACHGKTGKGDGPAAVALKDPVPDLTTLAQRYQGKYPAGYVASVLRFGTQGNPAHGNKDMPIWGPIFRSMSSTASSTSGESMRIANLNRYLESLQTK